MTTKNSGPAPQWPRDEAGPNQQHRKLALPSILRNPRTKLIRAVDDPYAVAVADADEWSTAVDERGETFPRVKRYRNRPATGHLEYRDPETNGLTLLSNVCVDVQLPDPFTWEPDVDVELRGCRDVDIRSTRSFVITLGHFVTLAWITEWFGPLAWHRRDLADLVIEGYLATSLASAPRTTWVVAEP